MYNEDIKKKFISGYTRSIHTAEAARTVFNAMEPYETVWGADLCTRSAEQLQPAIDNIMGLRSYSKWTALTALREYTKWCMLMKLPGACDGMMHVDTLGLEKIRKRMVASPFHLQKYFNEVFDAESEETIDNIYRCYLWLAYDGMSEEDALNVRSDDVDFQNMLISCNDIEIPIRHEALPAFRNAATLKSFRYKHPNYKPVRRDRAAGDTIMRGIKANTQVMTIRSTLSKRFSEAFKENRTELQLSFYRIWLSGLFYRMYERERAGVQVNFSEIAVREMAGRDYSLNGGGTLKQKENRKAKDYMEDYQRWKLAFSI